MSFPRRVTLGRRGRDCYRFALSSPDIDACVTGPKNAAELTEALAALDDGALSAAENERFRRMGAAVTGKAPPALPATPAR